MAARIAEKLKNFGLHHCVVAVLIVAAAGLLRTEMLAGLGMRAPFLTFYPAVFFAALFCRFTGGLLATVVSLFSVDFFWMEPARQLLKRDPVDQLSAAVFLLSGLLVSYAADRLHRARAAEAQAKITEERLLAEEKIRACNSQAERQLRESEAKARARANELAVLMDTVPAITFIAHDPEGRYISCGKKAREFLHVPEGGNCSMSAPKEERHHTFRIMKDGKELLPQDFPVQMAARGCEARNCELTVVFDDGTSRDILGDAVTLYDNSGKVRGAIGAFLDITEQKKIRVELEKARAELEKRVEERTAQLHQANEALREETKECKNAVEAVRERDRLLIQQGRLAAMGEMISNIAHQWRQPLNSIALIVQELPVMYKMGEFSEAYLNDRIGRAKEIIFHMSKTIDDFRGFFRPGYEKMEFKARDMILKTLSLVEESLKALEIETEVEAAGDPVIYGYPTECSQVVLNIVLNSRDAFQDRQVAGPRNIIRIRTFGEDGRTVITIADNAGGIPEAILDRIFDPYFSTKGPDKGTGIGLFMAKNIIENHMNGKIIVRNVEGGAEFRIEMASSTA